MTPTTSTPSELGAAPGWASHTPDDAYELAEAGHAACGHAALAAALGVSVREVLPHFIKQGEGLWVSEKRMRGAISAAGFHWYSMGLPWPQEMSVSWLQGLGTWMNKGVPMGARNARTHWVASASDEHGEMWVYDINISDWLPFQNWRWEVMSDILTAWKAKDYEVRATLLVKPNAIGEARRDGTPPQQ